MHTAQSLSNRTAAQSSHSGGKYFPRKIFRENKYVQA